MRRSRSQFGGGALPQDGSNGPVRPDRASRPSNPQNFSKGSPQGHDPKAPRGLGRGKRASSIQLSVASGVLMPKNATKSARPVLRCRFCGRQFPGIIFETFHEVLQHMAEDHGLDDDALDLEDKKLMRQTKELGLI